MAACSTSVPPLSDVEHKALDSSNHKDEVTKVAKHYIADISKSSSNAQASVTVSDNDASERPACSWKTRILRLAPLSGLFSIMLAIGSILAALGILVGSRGAAKDSWSVPPSTYLAICTAVANQALRFAAFQGVVVTWWYGALQGSTLAQVRMFNSSNI